MDVNQGTLQSFVINLVLMEIMDKIAPGNAMLHVLVVTKLMDCVILAVIQDGRGTTVRHIAMVTYLEKIVASHVDTVLIQYSVIILMEPV